MADHRAPPDAEPLRVRATSIRNWLTVAAYVFLGAFVVVILALMGYLLIWTIFSRKGISDAQYKALWVFIGSALATSVTLISLLISKAQNERAFAFRQETEARDRAAQAVAESRQTLDTVVRCLDLVTAPDGNYAPTARIAGSLAALIHLHHPVIAMRTLSAAWMDKKVDSSTAVWLIGEVLASESTSTTSKAEAARLLYDHAGDLCGSAEGPKGEFAWPDVLWTRWLKDLPREARFEILFAAVSVLLSRPENWWGPTDGWVAVLLDEALLNDDDRAIRESAWHLLRAFISEYKPRGARWPWRDSFKTPQDIAKHLRSYKTTKRHGTMRASQLAN